MKLKLKKHFERNCNSNEELIGLKVVTLDGDVYYINDFDRFTNSDELPRSVWIAKKPDTLYGWSKDSDELYVEIS